MGVSYQFPTGSELRDPAWLAANWGQGITDAQDLNSQLCFPFPSSLQQTTTTSNIDLVPYREIYLHNNLPEFRTL